MPRPLERDAERAGDAPAEVELERLGVAAGALAGAGDLLYESRALREG